MTDGRQSNVHGVDRLLQREISRRGFMRMGTGAGILLGVGGIFEGCSDSKTTPAGGPATEARSYYFDLSHADASREYHLVAGGTRHPLQPTDSVALGNLRATNGTLAAVPDAQITHFLAGAPFPSGAHQLCYVTSSAPGTAQWRVEAMFIHLPVSFEQALATHQARSGSDCRPPPTNAIFGASAGTDYCSYYSQYKTSFDTAKSLIFHHPDIMSLDPATATYVLNQIVCSRYETVKLAAVIYQQLAAGSSWAVHTPIIDDTTGKPYKNRRGQDQYSITWTQKTSQAVGEAVLAIQKVLKDDTSLGANITGRRDVSASSATAASANADLQGKLWMRHDGIPSVDQSRAAAVPLGAVASPLASTLPFNLTLTNQSTERGYRIQSFTADASTRRVTVQVKNWYARYLGLYVRYFDADGNVIKVPSDISGSLEPWQKGHSFDYDTIWGVVQPEEVVLGLPLSDFVGSFSFPVPASAASVAVVAGGLGTGHSDYPNTLAFGAALTACMNLAVPMVFLLSLACTAYGGFASGFSQSSLEMALMAEAFKAAVDVAVATETADSSVYMNLAADIGGVLLKGIASRALAPLATRLAVWLREGELEDAIPFVGMILTAIAAAGMAAQIGETVAEIVRSPKSFDYKLVFTHDVTVTIHRDHDDPVGFPATAATYEVVALLDKATTRRSGRIALTTFRTDTLSYTFVGLPQGGKVKYTVGFYAEDGWSAGQGQTDEIDNLGNAVDVTIKEIKVPLTASTYYWHLQKTTADAKGTLAWTGTHQSPAAAPTAKQDALSCANLPGTLCSLAGISVSESYAAIGYGWQSYSPAIQACTSGSGQLYQFRTLSLRDPPQSTEILSPCGSRMPFRTVFSLLGTTGDNYYVDPTSGTHHVRQIRFTEPGMPAAFDAPGTNRSFGVLNLPPDGLVLHPLRKLISINRAMSVIEILELPSTVRTDANAPRATIAAGEGTRPGLLSNPTCVGMTTEGTILVLEAGNARVQAFDTGMNAVPLFNAKKDYWFGLKAETESVLYLDMDVEYAGYVYILSCGLSSKTYRLDIYSPDGAWVCRTEDVNAAAFTVDFWRNVYALTYEAMTAGGLTSPAISFWVPSVP